MNHTRFRLGIVKIRPLSIRPHDLEQKIGEVLQVCAKTSGDVGKLQVDIAELKATSVRQADLGRVQVEIAEIKSGGAKQADLYKAQIEIAEVKGKVASLPTTWVMIGTMITTLLAGFAIVNYQFAKATVLVDRNQGKTTPQ